MSGPIVTLTIPGRPIVKKNTQRVVGFGKSRRRILSPKYIAWERAAMLSAMATAKRPTSIALLDIPVRAVFRFYFKDRQAEADVSNLIEGPQDLLVKLGVLKDDRLVRRVEGEKFFGHEPRVEIEIYRYEEAK